MKYKLLKDLPTCQAGTIGVKEGSQIVFDKNTRNPYFFEISEIEHKTDWFLIIEESLESLRNHASHMYQLLEKIRTSPIHEMHDLKCEIDELLKSIES